MVDSINLCNINKFYQKRFVFVDEEGIYYFWQLSFSEFGASIEIVPFIKKENRFIQTETPKVGELIGYLKWRLEDKNAKEIRDFFYALSFRTFSIPKGLMEKFGEEFCEKLAYDHDSEFIYTDPYAKHWVIDFAKVRNKEMDFLKEPELLPFTFTELGVTVTKECELMKNGKTISIDGFEKAREEYKKNLVPIIKQKDRIFRKIEKDLYARFMATLKKLESKKISDYEIEPQILVFDTLLGYDELLRVWYTKEIFEDREPYSLSIFGLDLGVCHLTWRLLDTLGLRAVQAKLSFWSEVRVREQKFFIL